MNSYKVKFLLLLLLLLGASPTLLKGQEIGKELLLNGGLEKYWRKKAPLEGAEPAEELMTRRIYAHHWRPDDQLGPTKVRGGHTGAYCLLIYLNGGSIGYHDNDYSRPGYISRSNIVPIEAGGEYAFSLWYRGDYLSRGKVWLEIEWYKGDRYIKRDTQLSAFKYRLPNVGDEWKEHSVSFAAPAGVDCAALSLRIDERSGKKLYLDDLSLKQVKRGATVQPLPTPGNLTATAMQHEVTLSWRAIAEGGAVYEIYCDGTKVGTTSSTTFVHRRLPQDRAYSYTIRAVKDSATSAATAPVRVRTKRFIRSIDDPTRLPHLYTISKDGEAPRLLRLFYTDLIIEGAQLSYHLDGMPVIPVDDTLALEPGRHSLSVTILEKGSTEPLVIEYDLTVK